MRIKYPNLIVNQEDSILVVLKKMDASKRKLLIVLDGDIFISVISIGDIQRAIIKNISLDTPISKILRKEVRFAFAGDDLNIVRERMKERRNELMPIVSASNKLVDIIFWEDLFKETFPVECGANLNLPVVIMAGGIGTRLKPLTNILPKPLIPIGEKTIIEQIMDKFCDAGCNTFYLSVNYKAEMIKYYFSTLPKNSYHISYLHEEKPLGTAGSLHLLKGKINSAFFVSNCDILVDQDISEIYEYHRSTKNEITIVAALKNYSIPYGILETSENGLLRSITEKPELTFKINTGFYILEPHLLDEIPQNEFYHITTLIDKLRKENRRVGVFPVSEKSWKDIGEWNEYQKFIN
jgi:dTDP-glucose pyrophosphorylase